MDKKRTLLIAVLLGGLIVLIWCAAVIFTLNKWINANKDNNVVVVDVTSCDVDASGLCVVSFGVDNVNRMVINFQLPTADYAAFYVKAHHGEEVSVYPCQVVEEVPTSVYCTGARTPLGNALDIEIYTTDGDVLIGRGTLVVSAIALPTTINVTVTPTPGGETATPPVTPTGGFFPTATNTTPITPRVTPTRTPTPSGYPSP